jgi:hypothetical protein
VRLRGFVDGSDATRPPVGLPNESTKFPVVRNLTESAFSDAALLKAGASVAHTPNPALFISGEVQRSSSEVSYRAASRPRVAWPHLFRSAFLLLSHSR